MISFILRISIVLKEYISKDCFEEICEILSLEKKVVLDIPLPPMGYNLKFKDGSHITVQKGNLILDENGALAVVEIIEECEIFSTDSLKKSNIKLIESILEIYKNWHIIINGNWRNKL